MIEDQAEDEDVRGTNMDLQLSGKREFCRRAAWRPHQARTGHSRRHKDIRSQPGYLARFSTEWNNKAAGFVSYGGAGGARAVEQLRLVLAEVQIATVRNQVLLSMFTDFENFSVFKPASHHEKSVHAMFDQVIAWGGALKTLREKRA